MSGRRSKNHWNEHCERNQLDGLSACVFMNMRWMCLKGILATPLGAGAQLALIWVTLNGHITRVHEGQNQRSEAFWGPADKAVSCGLPKTARITGSAKPVSNLFNGILPRSTTASDLSVRRSVRAMWTNKGWNVTANKLRFPQANCNTKTKLPPTTKQPRTGRQLNL